MARSAQIRNYWMKQVVTSGIMLSVWLGMTSTTFAHSTDSSVASTPTPDSILVAQTYNPPPPSSGSPAPRGSGGPRGVCTGQSSSSLLAIAPQAHVGQTSSTRPTVAWYVPDVEPYDLVFQLFQGSSEDPLYDISMTSRKGFMTWSVPASAPALVVGETYRWRVILICDRNRPSLSARDGAVFTVVAPPTTTAAANSVDYARQMAAAGVWYDALAVIVTTPTTAALRSLRSELLNDLAQLEASGANADTRRADNLRGLAELEP
jgi:Domain of Unknown Function (DUF928)